MTTDRKSHGLWAITCYFSPTGARSRLAHYRAFRKALTVPLVTVELSSGSDFHLQATDAEILIRVKSPDVMWQKERLLNIALRSVPRECSVVAWLDCDIVFQRHDWPEATCRALDRFPLVQMFDELCDLPRGATPAAGSTDNCGP